MSLPSIATFHMNDGTEKEVFVNIGWVYNEQYIPDTVMDATIERKSYDTLEEAKNAPPDPKKFPDDSWHSVTLYGKTYTKSQLNYIMDINAKARIIRKNRRSNLSYA